MFKLTKTEIACFLVFLILIGLAGASDRATASTGGYPAPVVCQEDDPCWNWATMGNMQRGIAKQNGRREVVNACRFAYLNHTGRIDWNRTPHLKGDRLAERRGCDYRWFA